MLHTPYDYFLINLQFIIFWLEFYLLYIFAIQGESMSRKNILTESAVEAHTEILLPENYRNQQRFEDLIEQISQSVTEAFTQTIIEKEISNELVESFNSYDGILDDTRLDMVNLWMQSYYVHKVPTVSVCEKHVPAVCPFNISFPMTSRQYLFDNDYFRHGGNLNPEFYQGWLKSIEDEEEVVETVEPEAAVESMKERLLKQVKIRLSHYYNTRINFEAIGIPYSSTKLQVTFKSSTSGARVVYTPIYCYSPQSTNGLTSPVTAFMDPGTYELRIVPTTGRKRKEPGQFGIHKSQTIQMTI